MLGNLAAPLFLLTFAILQNKFSYFVTRLKNILIIKFKGLLILESSLIISSFGHLFYLAYSLEYCSRFIDMLDQTGHGCSFSL